MASILCVGRTATEDADDLGRRSLLEGDGHTVTYVQDSATEWGTGAEGDFDAVVIGSSDMTDLGSKYQSTSLPVILHLAPAWASFGLCSTQNSQIRTTVYVADDTHALAGGLTGTVTVLGSSSDIYYTADPAASAALVIERLSGAGHWVVFEIKAGENLADGSTPAPGARIAFGLAWPSTYGANGDTLFLAAVDRALALGGAGGGGSANIPAIMHHYRQMRVR